MPQAAICALGKDFRDFGVNQYLVVETTFDAFRVSFAASRRMVIILAVVKLGDEFCFVSINANNGDIGQFVQIITVTRDHEDGQVGFVARFQEVYYQNGDSLNVEVFLDLLNFEINEDELGCDLKRADFTGFERE